MKAFVGTAEDVAGDMAHSLGACVDLEHDVLAREIPRHAAGTPPHAAGTLGQGARTRGFVKIQDGCDCHCAYCIIPTVRGEARSRPASAVLEEARRRVDQGQPEMVMTGISVGDYRDPERGLELGELMVAVAQVPGVERVRLSSVEVIHVKDSLLARARDRAEGMPAPPRPDAVRRRRRAGGDGPPLHARASTWTIVAALREAVPQVNLTTDVIVGFPTEDDVAFERTLDAIDAAGITPRPRVLVLAAARDGRRRLGDRVAPEEKKRRSRELRGRSRGALAPPSRRASSASPSAC